jgi:hypothetical protein
MDMEDFDIETKFRASLGTLESIGSSSAMSIKAHRCLQRYAEILSNIGKSRRTCSLNDDNG